MSQLSLTLWADPKPEPNMWDVVTHVVIHWDYMNTFGDHYEGLSLHDRFRIPFPDNYNHDMCAYWSSEKPNYCYKKQWVLK